MSHEEFYEKIGKKTRKKRMPDCYKYNAPRDGTLCRWCGEPAYGVADYKAKNPKFWLCFGCLSDHRDRTGFYPGKNK